VNKLAFAHADLPIVRMLVDEADAIADGLLQVRHHPRSTSGPPERLSEACCRATRHRYNSVSNTSRGTTAVLLLPPCSRARPCSQQDC